LDILSRCEVAIAFDQARGFAWQQILLRLGFLKQFCIGLVVILGNLGQYAQLLAGNFAVRHRHAKHGCIALHVPTVLKAQGPELII